MLTLTYVIYIIFSDEIDKPFYTAYAFFFLLIFGLLIWIMIGCAQRCNESKKKQFAVDIDGAPQTVVITVVSPKQESKALETEKRSIIQVIDRVRGNFFITGIQMVRSKKCTLNLHEGEKVK